MAGSENTLEWPNLGIGWVLGKGQGVRPLTLSLNVVIGMTCWVLTRVARVHSGQWTEPQQSIQTMCSPESPTWLPVLLRERQLLLQELRNAWRQAVVCALCGSLYSAWCAGLSPPIPVAMGLIIIAQHGLAQAASLYHPWLMKHAMFTLPLGHSALQSGPSYYKVEGFYVRESSSILHTF